MLYLQPPLKKLVTRMLSLPTTPETMLVMEKIKDVCKCLGCDNLDSPLAPQSITEWRALRPYV